MSTFIPPGASAPSGSESLKGLPPVTPPTGKFIAQLFLVPGLIVAVAVGCIWFVSWLVGGFLTPEQFVKDLRSGNAEVRWRRASDLAQVFKRDESLTINVKFALDLTELLRQALREGAPGEKAQADRVRQGINDERAFKQLQDERTFEEYLIASLGSFSLPVGVPLLTEIAVKEDGADAATVALHRQLAVWALANVGENLKRFDRLSPEKKTLILADLETATQDPSPERAQWAQESLTYLRARADGKPEGLAVDQTLARCATADDPTLRKFTALALTFWQGSTEENRRMEQTLLAMTKDDGHGTDVVARSKNDDRAAGVSSSLRGREIRYQAVQALARRGSTLTAGRLPLLGEMMDEEFQAKGFHTQLKDGRDVPDGGMVGTILTGALKSVAELRRKQPSLDLTSLQPAIDKLAKSDNPALRTEAEKTLLVLKESK